MEHTGRYHLVLSERSIIFLRGTDKYMYLRVLLECFVKLAVEEADFRLVLWTYYVRFTRIVVCKVCLIPKPKSDNSLESSSNIQSS